jgi:hypothetical protein
MCQQSRPGKPFMTLRTHESYELLLPGTGFLDLTVAFHPEVINFCVRIRMCGSQMIYQIIAALTFQVTSRNVTGYGVLFRFVELQTQKRKRKLRSSSTNSRAYLLSVSPLAGEIEIHFLNLFGAITMAFDKMVKRFHPR